MFGNVTGISILVGFGFGLPPLASQAYGAKNYKRVGNLMQRQLAMELTTVCIPVAIVWASTESILVYLHQPAHIARLAGQFLTWRLVSLPFYTLQLNIEALMASTQAPVLSRMLTCGSATVLNLFLFWLLIPEEQMNLGFIGAPLSMTIVNIYTALVLYAVAPYSLVSFDSRYYHPTDANSEFFC